MTDIEVQHLDDNQEVLGLLSCFEGVTLAEKPGIPILVIPEKLGLEPITDFSKICGILGVPEPGETCDGEACAL